jgi:hypothetical protein
MQKIVTVVLLWAVVADGGNWDMPPVGTVYVCEKKTEALVEFSSNNTFYAHLPCEGFVKGRCFTDARSCMLRVGEEEIIRLQMGEAGSLVDNQGRSWTTNLPVVFHNDYRAPLTVRVIDRETKKPVADYRYNYSLHTQKYDESPPWVRMHRVQNTNGAFRISAPLSCKLRLDIESDDFLVHGYGAYDYNYLITSDDTNRLVTVELMRGATYQGVVRDADSGALIEGATVIPLIFMPPLLSGDWRRKVQTDTAGHYELHGVKTNWGVTVSAPGYCGRREINLKKDEIKNGIYRYNFDIELSRGTTLTGGVQDESGRPLEGVRVAKGYFGHGSGVATDNRGRFALSGFVPQRRIGLCLSKNGFINEQLELNPTNSITVVMKKLYRLSGRVSDPEGQPVPAYKMMYGPGRTPQDFKCESLSVSNRLGEFELEFETPGTNWIAVTADGSAVAERWYDIQRNMDPVEIRLQPGVQLSGRVIRENGEPVAAAVRIVPQRQCEKTYVSSLFGFEIMGSRQIISCDKDGRFVFDHVAPASYTLSVSNAVISPGSYTCYVPPGGRDVGDIKEQGVGTIEGVAYAQRRRRLKPGEKPPLKKLARGRAGNVEFKTDENGRFRADGVWAGEVSAGFEYNATADVVGWYGVRCTVVPGSTTTVTVVDTPRRQTNKVATLRCNLKVGDGSESDLLSASGGRNLRFGFASGNLKLHLYKAESSGKSRQRRLTVVTNGILSAEISNLLLGEYRMSVNYDQWGNGRFSVATGSINVEEGTNTAEITLPSTCITGRLDLPNEDEYYSVDILCLASNKIVQSYNISCTNSLMLSFLPADEYILRMHCDKYGWAEVDSVMVTNGIVKLAPVSLHRGGTITGRTFIDWEPTCHNVRVKATDELGFQVSSGVYFNGCNDDRYTFRNLWPGKWKLEYTIGDKNVYSTNLVLHGTETITADIIRHSSRQP